MTGSRTPREPRAGLTFLGTPATAPGPLGPDMLRDLRRIRSDPLAYLARTWRRYGDVAQFPIPRPATYLVTDPAAVRTVLVETGRRYGKDTIQYRSLALLTGEGLLAADTAAWRRQRALVQPAFQPTTLDAVGRYATRVAAEVARRWRAGGAGALVDVEQDLLAAALRVVGHALFGTDLSADADRLTRATLTGLDVVVARARVPVSPPGWVPTPGNRRLRAAGRQLDESVRAMVTARQRDGASDRPTDMLDLLLRARDAAGGALTARELRDQIVTFIVAGHETVATALTWALALVADDPSRQERLRAEADAVLGSRRAEPTDVVALPYARAVFDEAMRLYPPAWLITRRALVDDELAGRAIPAGALVIMSPWLVHRHPDRWERPEAFEPERFLDRPPDRDGFLPFGAGPRICIGRDFAYTEGVLMLATLARAVDLSYPAGARIPAAVPLVTTRPAGGLHLRVRPRD